MHHHPRHAEERRAFPISGYRTAVDWAGSAVIEFLYFDLIMMRGLTPGAASEQVVKLLPFAGDKWVPGTVIASAGFRLLLPEKAAARK